MVPSSQSLHQDQLPSIGVYSWEHVPSSNLVNLITLFPLSMRYGNMSQAFASLQSNLLSHLQTGHILLTGFCLLQCLPYSHPSLFHLQYLLSLQETADWLDGGQFPVLW